MNLVQHLFCIPVSLSHVIAIAGRGDVLAGAVLLRPRANSPFVRAAGERVGGRGGEEHDTF